MVKVNVEGLVEFLWYVGVDVEILFDNIVVENFELVVIVVDF